MTTSQMFTVLMPAIVAFLVSVAGYIKAHTTTQKLNDHLDNVNKPGNVQ